MTTSGKLRVENKVISLKYIRTLATLYHCNFDPLWKTPVSSSLPRLCENDETGVFEWIAFCAAVFGKIYATKSKLGKKIIKYYKEFYNYNLTKSQAQGILKANSETAFQHHLDLG